MSAVCTRRKGYLWYRQFFFMSCRLQGKENMKIDYYAYHSGMNGWNAGLKMLLAVGTLCLTIALDKPAVSLFVLLTMSLLTLIKGKIPGKAYLHFLSVPLAFVIMSGVAIAAEFGRSPLGDWNLHIFFFICVFTAAAFCWREPSS